MWQRQGEKVPSKRDVAINAQLKEAFSPGRLRPGVFFYLNKSLDACSPFGYKHSCPASVHVEPDREPLGIEARFTLTSSLSNSRRPNSGRFFFRLFLARNRTHPCGVSGAGNSGTRPAPGAVGGRSHARIWRGDTGSPQRASRWRGEDPQVAAAAHRSGQDCEGIDPGGRTTGQPVRRTQQQPRPPCRSADIPSQCVRTKVGGRSERPGPPRLSSSGQSP